MDPTMITPRSQTNLPAGLDLTILGLIAHDKGPIGQSTLSLRLREQGFNVSTPTVGRRLQVLEFEGLLRKVGVEGRVMTPDGTKVLAHWEAEAQLRSSGEALFETLKRGDKKHILDLLSARRVIESETVALAAEHASPTSIQRLEELVAEQDAIISRGGLGVEQDIAFHLEIARASQNEVLHSLVGLLRNNRRYDLIVTSMRRVVGRLVVDHRAILSGIKDRDPQVARRAMEQHIGGLMLDLNRYRSRVRRS
jgi:DNA-binding FadR family transcriptional regulator